MPAMTAARAYVDIPSPAKVPHGLFSRARVLDVSGHELLGAEYQTHMCGLGGVWADNCPGAYPATPCSPDGTSLSKDFDGLALVTGDPITAYKGIECPGPGSQDGLEAKAVEALDFVDQRIVEQGLAQWVQANGEPLQAPVNPLDAIGLLEMWLAGNYAGLGLIHMSPYAVTQCASLSLIVRNPDGTLETFSGTPVVSGQGYTFSGDGFLMFATGQVTVLRGPVEAHTVPEMTAGANCSPARSLAERQYVPLIECGSAWLIGSACHPCPTP